MKGQGIVEYALILVLIMMVVVCVVSILGPLVRNVLEPAPPPAIYEARWQEITPPPGYDGKCYSFKEWNGVELVCIPESDL